LRRAALVLAAAAAFAATPGAALAAGVVSNANDMGTGSLRQAVSGGGSVTFAPGVGPIQLNSAIAVTAPVTISDPEIDVTVAGSFSGPLLDFQSGSTNSSVSGVNLTNPTGEGVRVASGLHVNVQRSPIYNVTQPIDLVGGTTAPTLLTLGHRQADGTLPLSGTSSAAGTIDAYDGDPTASTPTTFVGAAPVSASGAFTVPLSGNPTGGGTVRATLTSANGTSEYSAPVAVPADVTSPALLAARAMSTNELVATPSEPLVGGSVGLNDFALTMAGTPRKLVQGGIEPGSSRIYLISSQPWRPGEAGSLAFSTPGAVSDGAGNVSSSTTSIPVGAAPGDFEPPVLTGLSMKPSRFCLVKTRSCRRPGVTVTFTTSEPGRAVFSIYSSSSRRAGTFVKRLKTSGVQHVKWSGVLNRKRLRAGRYVIEIVETDAVGNATDDAPYRTFRVLSTR
jgi:hypothetical protein